MTEWAQASRGRHDAAANTLAESHQALSKALETAAQSAQARLADGRTRLTQQRQALAALLIVVEEGRAFEVKLKGALEELEGAEAAAHTQRSGRLEQFANALAAASEAQHAGQRDEAVLEAVHRAAQVLKESTAQAHAALEEQRTLLGAAGEQ